MELWAWGANTYGQLGVGARCEQIEKPAKVPLPCECMIVNDACQIAGGGGHTLLVDSSRQRLYATGWNNKGQLGLGNHIKEVETFVEVNLREESGQRLIKKVACGWDFSLVLLDDGTVIRCGSNAFGQLGAKEDVKMIESFKRITPLSNNKIIDIACGMRHTLFLDASGRVYGTGCGKKGQLGLGDSVKRLFLPTLISEVIPLARSVHCGQHFSVAVTTSQTGCSEMFTFGDNKYNQTSDSSEGVVYKPKPKKLCFSNENINVDKIVISCGWTHVMLLRGDAKKKVISCGRNDYGQLGRIYKCENEKIGDVDLPEVVTKIASGYEHVLAVSETGNLYAWGWNEHLNCGVGIPQENIMKPKVVPFDDQRKVINCYAGSGHSFALLQPKTLVQF